MGGWVEIDSRERVGCMRESCWRGLGVIRQSGGGGQMCVGRGRGDGTVGGVGS